jgi:hypothetical protein
MRTQDGWQAADASSNGLISNTSPAVVWLRKRVPGASSRTLRALSFKAASLKGAKL